ncbi:MAG: hypothetical protein WC516_02280 [Patescibacteria group bacterium]
MTKNEKNQKHEEKKIKTFHPFDIKISRNIFPKRKGNKSRLYAKKINDDISKLHDSEMNLIILNESIKSYKKIFDKRAKQKRPTSFISRITYLKEIDSFDVEYENFCMRLYNFRETLRNFISEFLGIKAYGYNNFKDDSKIRELGVDKIFRKFEKNNIGQVLNDRKNITHRITKDFEDENKKITSKLSQQKENLDNVTKSVIGILKIKDTVCNKITSNK